jgi:ELWxxDGT repeat protein
MSMPYHHVASSSWSHLPASAVLLGYMLCSSLVAAEPYLVKDIDGSGAAVDAGGVLADGRLVYAHDRGDGAGTELWSSDGTVAGTSRVKDIFPGGGSSSPTRFHRLSDGRVLFAANDGSGMEPWITNGTAAGTTRVTDLHPTGSSNPHSFVQVDTGDVYFVANDGANGAELFRWTGSSTPTRVSQIGTGAADGFVGGTDLQRGVSGNTAFFYAGSASLASGGAVVGVNGNAAKVLTSIIPAGKTPPGAYFARLPNGKVVFSGYTTTAGTELWLSDGSVDGTGLLKDFAPGSGSGDPDFLTAYGNKVYFSCQGGPRIANNSAAPRGLWATDGTVAGTTAVSTAMNPSDEYYGPINLAVAAGHLYFATSASGTTTLWRSNGTADGTVSVSSQWGSPYSGSAGNQLSDIVDVGGTVYFLAGTEATGKELWRIPPGGSPTASPQIMSGADGLEQPTGGVDAKLFGGGASCFILGNTGKDSSVLLAGTTGSLTTLAEAPYGPGDGLGGVSGNGNDNWVSVGSKLVFSAFDTAGGWRIWATDGTRDGTVALWHPGLLIETAVDSANDLFFSGVAMHGSVVLSAREPPVVNSTAGAAELAGEEPRLLDVTTGAMTVLKDIVTGTEAASPTTIQGRPSSPRQFTVVGSQVYFAARETDVGGSLWRSDGTPGGTMRIADPNPTNSADVRDLTAMGGALFFTASTSATGIEIYRHDPTTGTTALLTDLNPGAGNLYNRLISNFAPVFFVQGGRMFFRATDGSRGMQLWLTDGSAAGTRQVATIRAGGDAFPPRPEPHTMASFGGGVVFAADDGEHGVEPWYSDGTESGTSRIADITTGVQGSDPVWFTPLGGWCYFVADGALWRTDGTSAVQIDGTQNLAPAAPIAVNGNILFHGTDAAHGRELWRFDGSSITLVADLEPGETSSRIGTMDPVILPNQDVKQRALGNLLLFPATVTGSGREMWGYMPPAGTAGAGGYGSGSGNAAPTITSAAGASTTVLTLP